MNREKELLKNTIILTIGRYLPKLFALITLPIITGVLSKKEYGTYDLITTMVSLFLPIVTLQIQSAAFRFLIDCRSDKNKASKIISNIIFFTICVSVLAVSCMMFFYKKLEIEIRLLVSIYFVIDIVFLTLGQIARGLSYNQYYTINAIIYSAINMIFIVCTVYVGHLGLTGVLISFILANIIASLYLTKKIKLVQYLHYNLVSKNTLAELLGYSWPMVPNNLSQWVLKISDRLVISSVLGLEANAIYAVANKIPNLLMDAQGVFSMAWQENASIASNDKDSEKYYSSVFDTFHSLVMGCAYLLIAMTPVLFKLLIKGDYNEAYNQMPILIVGTLFGCLSSFQGGVYVAFKRTKAVGISTMVAAASNLFLDILLVKKIGITAGSISTLISYILLFTYRMYDVQKFQKIVYKKIKLMISMMLLGVMCFLTFQQNIILDSINFSIAVISAVYLNINLIKNIFIKVKNRYRTQ